jgi:hypothetical protein
MRHADGGGSPSGTRWPGTGAASGPDVRLRDGGLRGRWKRRRHLFGGVANCRPVPDAGNLLGGEADIGLAAVRLDVPALAERVRADQLDPPELRRDVRVDLDAAVVNFQSEHGAQE